MPSGNRTGPMGQGPRTGRALGFCSGYDTPGYTKGFGMGMGRGMGQGMGMGRGRGFGRGFNFGGFFPGLGQFLPWQQSVSKDDEIRMLKSQAEALSRTQADLEKRLRELENRE
ncbi:MAG: DUF5320 domain-containing protein [Mangrovibacterium sp.]|nr:DUF5320 domain-containing protein [Mangrovibacterium sp.]